MIRTLFFLFLLTPALTLSGSRVPVTETYKGTIAHYSRVWDWNRIARNQGLSISPNHIGIAYWDCKRLGEHALLWVNGTGPWPAHIVDCTNALHLSRVRDQLNIVAEVSDGVRRISRFDGLCPGKIEFVTRDVSRKVASVFWPSLCPRCR